MSHSGSVKNAIAPDRLERKPDKDAAIAMLIQGLNTLIAQSGLAGLGTASRILQTAKEDLVHWAVDMDFHENAKDRFLNRHLYDSSLHALSEFIGRMAAIEDSSKRHEIAELMKLSMPAWSEP